MNLRSLFHRKSMTEVIEQIHHEFNTEGDTLLQEANRILSTALNSEKGNRLIALGFSNTKEARKIREDPQKRFMSEAIAKTIQYFQFRYPNRFIDENGVKRICKKYGLICAEVGRYTGTVPEKNLSEIERFKLLEDDIIYEIIHTYYSTWNRIDEITAITKEEYNSFWSNYKPQYGVAQQPRTNQNRFLICAPAKDFDISDRERVVGYKIQNIPDPMVLKPVKGGYLIISAWGIEASDSEIVNPKYN